MTIGTITGPLAGQNAPTSASQVGAFSTGTPYALTNTAANLSFGGGTNPNLTLPAPGTYLLLARANVVLNGATLAANRTVTLTLRRSNNTAADLTNGTITNTTPITTTLTQELANNSWSVLYTTTNATDVILIQASIDTVPSAGSVDVNSASIQAIRLQQ